jgi:hypothetical protein
MLRLKLQSFFFIFIVSTSIHAESKSNGVNVNCLKVSNGKCESVNDIMINSTVDALLKIPETAASMLFNTNGASNNQQGEHVQGKSLQECMNGKKTIDNETIRCHNGYLK